MPRKAEEGVGAEPWRPTTTRRGAAPGPASPAPAQDLAEMVEAQNNGIYDAEPRDPGSTTATGFRRWCQDNLERAARS